MAAVSPTNATYRTLATIRVSQEVDPRNGPERIAQQAARSQPKPVASSGYTTAHRGSRVNLVV